jgi:hypothetical protein
MRTNAKDTYIRAAVLIGFTDLIEDAGLDIRELLAAANIDPAVPTSTG